MKQFKIIQITKLLLFIYMITPISSACEKGCLKCDKETEKCLFCDFTNNFALENDSCIVKTVENCSKVSWDGTCKECNIDYYPNNGVCVKATNIIQNCIVMKSPIECTYCSKNFYFDGQICSPVKTPIDNCQYYSSSGNTCEVCEEKAFLYIDKRYCIFLENFEGCAVWSQINCKNCLTNYFYDINAYIIDFLGNIKNKENTFNFISNLQSGNHHMQVTQNCLETSITNCDQFLDSKTCSNCSGNYLLFNNRCINPTVQSQSICKETDKETEMCILCAEGYYVSDGTCEVVDPIFNCKVYDNSAPFTKCVECETIYTLDLNKNECIPRKQSTQIENCEILHKTEDQCAKCGDGQILVDDGLKCLKAVENCKKYESSSIFSHELICQECAETFYYNAAEVKCTKGSVENCSSYKNYSDECTVCANGYFKNHENGCTKHTLSDVITCEKFSGIHDNVCIKCGDNQIKVRNRNSCNEIISTISNCKLYQDGDHCDECELGYLPNVDKTSCEMNTIQNCRDSLNPTQCAVCLNKKSDNYEIPYFLDVDKQCKEPLDHDFLECNGTKSSNEVISCHTCVKNFYPQKLPFNSKVCVARDNWRYTGNTKITNCLQYDSTDNKCIKCSDSYYVQDDGTCSQVCDLGGTSRVHMKEIYKNNNYNAMYIRKQKYCTVPDGLYTVTNCEIYGTSIRSDDQRYNGNVVYGCIKCKTGFTGVVDTRTNSPYRGQATLYNSETGKEELHVREPFFNQCVDIAVLTNSNKIEGALTILTNCKYLGYFDTGNVGSEKFGCLTCVHGYTGYVKEIPTDDFYIPECVIMSDCNSSQKYTGLGTRVQDLTKDKVNQFPLGIYVTCHECTDTNKIIFFGVGSELPKGSGYTQSRLGGLSTFDLSLSKPFQVDPVAFPGTKSNDQNRCIDPNESAFAILQIPDNCGVVQVVVDDEKKGYQEGETIKDTTFRCQACKPGYAFKNDQYGRIMNCQFISNCDVGSFAGCKTCSDGYMFGYSNDYLRIDFGQCLPNGKAPNCYAGIESLGKYYCRVCNKGYFVNLDGQCDRVNFKNCSVFSFIKGFQPNSNRAQETEKFEFLMTKEPSGCSECDPDYVAVYYTAFQKKNFCLENSALANDLATTDSFVEKCLKSFYDENLNKIRCLQCEDSYLLISGKCLQVKIDENLLKELENCNVIDFSAARCQKCEQGYFLSGGLCYKGYVNHCLEYTGMYRCNLCETGYVVITLNKQKASCFKISDKFNCEKWSFEASKVGELECETCKEGKYKDYNMAIVPPFMCFDIDVVKNCEIHDKNYNLKISTYNCLRCLPDYFLIENFCIPRTKIENCETYKITEDKCSSCKTSFFVDENGKCKESFSTNKENSSCEIFFDQDQCLKCAPNFYLNKDKNCISVPIDSKILNCLYYRAPADCLSCITDYFMMNGACVSSPARNCKEQKNLSECQSCFTGYGLKEESNGVTSCVEVQIQNCREFDPDIKYPFKCKKCAKHHFLNDQEVCQKLETAIEFCDVYQDANHCAQCEDRRALSEAKDGCFASNFIMEKTDQNCAQSFLISHPKCTICSFGYYWKNDACTKCSLLTPQSGCMQCNPEDEYECFICMPGYFQNNKGNCIRVAVVTDETDEKISSILKIFGLVLILLFNF